MFNTEPGPGTYMNIEDTIKDRIKNNDSTMTSRNYNVSSFHNNSSITESSVVEKQFNSPGFGSKNERFKEDRTKLDTKCMPGPGAYTYNPPVKPKGGLINPKPTVSLNFNENNPLNYVRPITVNLYFKQDNPEVGKYKIERPFGDTKKNTCGP